MTINWKHIVIGGGIVIFDLMIYILFGLLLMNYDDFYEESKGPYWSLESMTRSEKAIYVGFEIWNLLNVIAICYLVYLLLIKRRMSSK